MSDIKIDPSTGDIDLSTGTIVLVDGEEAIAQNLRIRLQFVKGEWFLDTRQGVPYFEKILGKKFAKSITDQIFKEVILSTPGITSLNTFSQTYDGATRTLTISFVAITDTGLPLTFAESFIVGAK